MLFTQYFFTGDTDPGSVYIYIWMFLQQQVMFRL